MTLYLMRHAEAVELGTDGITRDADRKLTDKGRRQAKRMGLLLRQMDVAIDRIIASPYVRAQETASLAAEKAGVKVKIQSVDALTPDGTDELIWDAICATGGDEVLLVGHMPSISNLAGTLLGSLAEEPLAFHKSTLVALRCEMRDSRKPRVRLEWMASPAMAKRLTAHRTSKGVTATQG